MNITVNKKASPVLLDRLIQDLQSTFEANFSWLNYAFGRAYRLVKEVDDKEYNYPAVYSGKAEYLSVLPDDTLGNFSFFEIDDPQEVDTTLLGRSGLVVKGSIIFWYSLDSIYIDTTMHYGEDVKKSILSILNTPGITKSGRISIIKVYERAENIYRGYNLKQIDHQYLMFPYAGLRVECEFKINELC